MKKYLKQTQSNEIVQGRKEKKMETEIHSLYVHQGQVFYISLPSNPSTGYQWRVHVGTGLKLLSTVYTPSCLKEEQKPGCGGSTSWQFIATLPLFQEILFDYVRPWEPNVPVYQVVYRITAK